MRDVEEQSTEQARVGQHQEMVAGNSLRKKRSQVQRGPMCSGFSHPNGRHQQRADLEEGLACRGWARGSREERWVGQEV